MDRAGEWRLIDSDEPEDPDEGVDEASPHVDRAVHPEAQASMRWVLALVAVAVVGVAGSAIWLTMPQPDVQLDVGGRVFEVGSAESPDASIGMVSSPGASPLSIVIDVEGAVQRPGLHRLSADARVGDAIAAAGGYSASVDIAAAAAQINLAERLTDGAKVQVPILGNSAPSAPLPTEGGASSTSTGGMIDINHATPEELDTLPGVGEVTVAKIIAAREEAPFLSVEDLAGRGVVGPATMDKVRELITVAP